MSGHAYHPRSQPPDINATVAIDLLVYVVLKRHFSPPIYGHATNTTVRMVLAVTQASAIKNEMAVCEHVSLFGYFIRYHIYVSEKEKHESSFHRINKKRIVFIEGKLS